MSSHEDKIKKLAIIGKRYLKGELRCPDCQKKLNPENCKINTETQTRPNHNELQSGGPSSISNDIIPQSDAQVFTSGHCGVSKDQDDTKWPTAIFEEPNPSVQPMYPKKMVYPTTTKEYSLEELKARDFIKKYQIKQNEEEKTLKNSMEPLKTDESIQKLMINSERKEEEVSSVNAQSVTLRTKMAWNVVQDMWNSPCSSASEPRDQQPVQQKKPIHFPIFDENLQNREPEPEPSASQGQPAHMNRIVKFDVFTDSSIRTNEFHSERKAATNDRFVPQLQGLSLSERKEADTKPITAVPAKSEARKSLHFKDTEKQVNPPVGLPVPLKPVQQNEMLDVSCSTRNFAFVLPYASTPVTKKRQQTAETEKNDESEVKNERMTQQLSAIEEASHERCSSSSGSQGSVGYQIVTPVDRVTESILKDTENVDPFRSLLKERLLAKMKFDDKNANSPDYMILPTKLPAMNKKIKLGSQMYSVLGEIGRGAYGRVMRARLPDGSQVSLKLEKPCCRWELYISQEIQKRVKRSVKAGFLNFHQAFIFTDGSILVAEFAELGTLLNAASQHKLTHNQPMGTSVAMHFAMEMFSLVDYLHRAKIIHADVKPDNFVLRALPQPAEKVPCLVLIDFGRSIDMELFPQNTTFDVVVTTDGFTSNEMKEKKPWTYHIDLYGLAASLHVILTSEYMKENVKKNGRWKLAKALPRTCVRDVWEPIFDSLLNHESFDPLDLSTCLSHVKNAYEKISDSAKKLGFTHLAQAITPK